MKTIEKTLIVSSYFEHVFPGTAGGVFNPGIMYFATTKLELLKRVQVGVINLAGGANTSGQIAVSLVDLDGNPISNIPARVTGSLVNPSTPVMYFNTNMDLVFLTPVLCGGLKIESIGWTSNSGISGDTVRYYVNASIVKEETVY